MPGEYNTYAAGYREVWFLVPEVTYGVPVHPSPTHAITIQTASLALAQERVNRADKTSSRSYRERITHRKEGTWTVTQYNLPSGTNGVAPDFTDALERGFGRMHTVAADAVTTGATTTVIPVADGTLYEVGDAIGWTNALGEVEVTFVASISTNDLTVSPPFSAAPADSDVLLGSVNYKPANQLGILTLTKVLDNIVSVGTGAFVNDVSFEFPGTAEGTVTFGGNFKTSYTSGVSAVAGGGINNAVTAITVTTGHGKRFKPNTRVLLSAEGANTDEVVLITAVVGDVLTVTRAQASTVASAHAAGAVIGPYQPASTVAGSPVSGTVGEFILLGLQGATRALSTAEIMSMTLSLTNNGSLRNDAFGTDSASGFQVQKREITFSLTLHLKQEVVKVYNQAVNFEQQEFMIQLGKIAGYICAAKVNKAEVTIPTLDGGGDEDVVVTLDGGGYAALSAGNDECYVSYL